MKMIVKLILIFVLVLAIPTAVYARSGAAPTQGPDEDKFILGDSYTLSEGDTLNGNLFILGGSAILQKGSLVNGDVILVGGNLDARGTISGNVASISGLIDLDATAVVKGDVNTYSGTLQRTDGAHIEGNVHSTDAGPFSVTTPGRIIAPDLNPGFNLIWSGMWWLFRSFLWAALAVLAVLFLPVHIERTSEALISQPLIAGGLGLMTLVVLPLILLVSVVTIIGIPVGLVGAAMLAAAWAFGVIAVGWEVGKRLTGLFHQSWAPAVSAGLGVFAVTLIANGIGAVVPCVGWVVPAVVGMLGLGAVLLTRFGTQNYVSFTPGSMAPAAPIAPEPPAAPLEPQ